MKTIKDVEISDRVADRMDQSRVAMHIIFDALIAEIKCQLRQGRNVSLSGFGELAPDMEHGFIDFWTDSDFADELSQIPDKN